MRKRVLLLALALLLVLSHYPSMSYAAGATSLDDACRVAATQTWYWPFSTTDTAGAYGKIISSYGYRYDEDQGLDGVHYGLDISMPKNTPVYPIQAGVVTYIKSTNSGSRGRYLIIEHDNGFCSMYLHLQEIKVSKGDRVYLSTEIALSGGSGKGSDSGYGSHLHLQILYGSPDSSGIIENGSSINPCPAGYTRKGSSFNKGYPMENASDSGGVKFSTNNPRVSYITIDRSTSAPYINSYLDEGCTSESCNVLLTVTTPGNIKNMPCSVTTNPQSETVEPLTVGSKYSSTKQWTNTIGHIWYEVTSTTGERGFIYSGDVSVSVAPSTLSIRDNIVSATQGTPSGSLTQGNNFGLRGIIESNYAIAHVEAHIYDSNGDDAVTLYSKDGWNKTSYNIQTDGINDHFSFRSLGNGTYHYVVKASDSFSNEIKVLIDSWFAVGTATPAQQYLDQCTSEPCDLTLTVTTTGNMKSMPCSVDTNAQSTTVESLIYGNTYSSKVRWKNTEGNIWFEVTSTTGQRGFIYIGDVSVTAIIGHGDYYAPSINSTISISEYEAGTPSGTLTKGSNFGLRGFISSDYPITYVEAHIYRSDGTDALPFYSTNWNSTNYNIRTDGINNHFSFRSLENGVNYNYTVLASDSSGATVTLIDSYFNVGASAPTVTKPEMPIVSVSSSQYAVGDSITISWTEAARNEYYWINVFKDGSLIVDQSMGTNLSYTLTNAQAGSYLVYVSANNSAGTSGSSSCTFTVNTTQRYSFKFSTPGGTYSGEMQDFTVQFGQQFTIPRNQYRKTGLTFTGWRILRVSDAQQYISEGHGWLTESEINQGGYSFQIYEDNATRIFDNSWIENARGTIYNYYLYPCWEANSYTVSFHANGGEVSEHSRTVTYGSRYGTLPVPTRTGCLFIGWFSDPNGGTQYTENTLVGTFADNQTLYAHWQVAINETNFPDTTFRAYVSENCDKDKDGYLSQTEIDSVTSINVSGTAENPGAITSLRGVEYFTKLNELSCPYNQLITLDLSSNVNLTYVACWNNQLTELILSNNPVLQALYCYNNQLTSLNLSDSTSLKYLVCSDNDLKKLYLNCRATLQELNCITNQLTNLNLNNYTELRYLYCESNQLLSLNLENCISLTSLFCLNNQLTELNIIGDTSLREVNCSNNQLVSLNLNSNTALQYLYCQYNQLTSIDVSQNHALTILWCIENQLTDLDVSNHAFLQTLWCGGNQLESLDVRGNDVLRWMDCAYNQLATLDLSDNPKLECLRCYGNQLTSLDISSCSVLQNCVKNGTLKFEDDGSRHYQISENVELATDNGLKFAGGATVVSVNENTFPDAVFRAFVLENYDIDGDSALAEMEIATAVNITCEGAGIKSLTGVEYFTSLTALICSGNEIEELDLSGNTLLAFLRCNDNNLTNLNVRGCSTLIELTCHNNQLSEIDVSDCNLMFLRCDNNQLTNLDVSAMTYLFTLNCSKNRLTSLDVGNCTILQNLYCSWNNISKLDISNCSYLQSFECGANPLGSLDVSNNPALTHLGCFENQLTELDLSNNTALQEMWCYSNQLNQLNLAGCPNLYFLSCWDNRLPALNIRDNTMLQRLFCYQNMLSSLDISACPNLVQLTTTALPTTENGVNQYADQENGFYLWFDEGVTLITSIASLEPDFILPSALSTIEEEAFTGGAFIYVKLPDNAISIGWHAFADCPNLAYIYIPALTAQIDDQAFGSMQGLTILGKAGSTAETYAQNHHYNFIAVP